MEGPRVVVIGAAGEMTRVAVGRLAASRPELALELYDLDQRAVQALAASLPRSPAAVGAVDLFEPARLGAVIEGASLVVLGAGPYVRTGPPVARACIAAGVDYLDLDDDIESTEDALRLDADARAAGTALLVGCGASPGMSNLLAVEAARRLDAVDTIDVCWTTGDEGARRYGAAVLEHVLHMAAGDCLTWRDGGPTTVPCFVANEQVPFAGDLAGHRVYETAHPEAVTLPRRFPEARSIRVLGGAHPQPVNGIIRGVAVAVHDGRMSTEDAVAWFQAVLNDEPGALQGWRHALGGVTGQVRRGECSVRDVARYVIDAARKRHPPYRSGLLARATGTRAGAPAVELVRTVTGDPTSTFSSSMGSVTGTFLAAFTVLALDRDRRLVGSLAPEDWVDLPALVGTLERLGVPRHEVLADELVAA